VLLAGALLVCILCSALRRSACLHRGRGFLRKRNALMV